MRFVLIQLSPLGVNDPLTTIALAVWLCRDKRRAFQAETSSNLALGFWGHRGRLEVGLSVSVRFLTFGVVTPFSRCFHCACGRLAGLICPGYRRVVWVVAGYVFLPILNHATAAHSPWSTRSKYPGEQRGAIDPTLQDEKPKLYKPHLCRSKSRIFRRCAGGRRTTDHGILHTTLESTCKVSNSDDRRMKFPKTPTFKELPATFLERRYS